MSMSTKLVFAVLEAVGHESLAAAARYEREGNGPAAKLYRERNDALLVAADAIRDKLERENRSPLTIAELMKMQDQAVWVEPKGDRLLGFWGVVEGASEYEGKKYLYLHGIPFCHILDEDYIAYRHKPKGVQK